MCYPGGIAGPNLNIPFGLEACKHGVDPGCRGRGYRSLLIRAKLAELDKQNVPCYLETMKEKNVSIYRHFGFEVVEEGIIPDTDVPMWAMLRKTE